MKSERGIVALATLALLAVAACAVWQLFEGSAEYDTRVAELRIVTLSDNSRISLDSKSVVLVHYDKLSRQLDLKQGRARFDMATDARRVAYISADNAIVITTSASVTIERLGGKVLVAVFSGRVFVQNETSTIGGKKPIIVTAGQELSLPRYGAASVLQSDPSVDAAWQRGVLLVRNVSLGETVERLRRYTDKSLSVDSGAAALRISGTFPSSDVTGFVSAVTTNYPVQTVTLSTDEILLEKRI